MNGALYTYINVCTYMHPCWKLLHPLCSWSGYVHGQSVLALSLSRGPYPVFCLYGIRWLVSQSVWVCLLYTPGLDQWVGLGTNLQGALRCHWNIWKYGAGNLRFPHAKEFIWKLSGVWACTHRKFHKPCKSSKNICLKGRQIISLSVAPVCLESALVHTSQIDSFYRTGIWKPFIFLKFTIHMSIWLLYVIMW
jgi:hypothetical protein